MNSSVSQYRLHLGFLLALVGHRVHVVAAEPLHAGLPNSAPSASNPSAAAKTPGINVARPLTVVMTIADAAWCRPWPAPARCLGTETSVLTDRPRPRHRLRRDHGGAPRTFPPSSASSRQACCSGLPLRRFADADLREQPRRHRARGPVTHRAVHRGAPWSAIFRDFRPARQSEHPQTGEASFFRPLDETPLAGITTVVDKKAPVLFGALAIDLLLIGTELPLAVESGGDLPARDRRGLLPGSRNHRPSIATAWLMVGTPARSAPRGRSAATASRTARRPCGFS